MLPGDGVLRVQGELLPYSQLDISRWWNWLGQSLTSRSGLESGIASFWVLLNRCTQAYTYPRVWGCRLGVHCNSSGKLGI